MGRSHVQGLVKDFEDFTHYSDFKQKNMVYSVKHEEILYTERQTNIYLGIIYILCYLYTTLLIKKILQYIKVKMFTKLLNSQGENILEDIDHGHYPQR